MPADDMFQIFRLHEVGDLFYSPTFPNADRSDIVLIPNPAITGYSPKVKQPGATLVLDRLAALGLNRDDDFIMLNENGDCDWLASEKEQA